MRERWKMYDAQGRGQFDRHRFHPVQVGLRRLFAQLDRVKHLAPENAFHRIQGNFDCSHDTKVAASASQAPEKVGIALFVDKEEAPISSDEINRAYTGGPKAILANQPAATSAKEIADHADGRCKPIERCQA